MPRIFDNIDADLLPTLRDAMAASERGDFCVGYFNLRGWRSIDDLVTRWPGGDEGACRLLVGMQRLPQEELRDALRLIQDDGIDTPRAARLKRELAQEFRQQLTWGAPTADDEAGLRRLAHQLRARQVVVKLFLRYRLHAKLYLTFRADRLNPRIGFLGSSNLTFAGLQQQGELNVDVLDFDATAKLASWFEDRWNDRFCVDITDELAEVIETSWARPELVEPYLVYLKMAYHLAQEARAGLAEFRIPADLSQSLLPFQAAAVKIAAHHLNRRGGVLLGDVVGLGKTLMATALARIFEDDFNLETLILCPKALVPMWEDYRERYHLRARVLSLSRVIADLPQLLRYRLVLIDESHNLRNREGRRYRAIFDYIQRNQSKVILLSATPYNKSFEDLSNQLRLFLAEDAPLPIRPEALLRELGEAEFLARFQVPPNTLAAFEKSEHADDWRELMRFFLVRRTRTFIKQNYAERHADDPRPFLTFEDGRRVHFPDRVPRTLPFELAEDDPEDTYARLFKDEVVAGIEELRLPRYGLGNYLVKRPSPPADAFEERLLRDLSRGGKRLIGFCRTNLFKRLESSGHSFLASLERHALRNFVVLHALDHDLKVPIGTQDALALDLKIGDEDADALLPSGDDDGAEGSAGTESTVDPQESALSTTPRAAAFRRRAAELYGYYRAAGRSRFQWLRANLFQTSLRRDLEADARALLEILAQVKAWNPARDRKLAALARLLGETHGDRKVLVFSQFADTITYLERELGQLGIRDLAAVTGQSQDPTELAWRFSPRSNGKSARIPAERERRVLLATDVLSEGQNLQDAAIVVNYDLPWAIIRLIQRAGRVDRIGQEAAAIHCYSFLPAEGVERLISLRRRVRQRLRENAEVVGTDEAFFDDEADDAVLLDLYNEKAGILDGEKDSEIDLASFAYQIWKNALDVDPTLEATVTALPPVVYATRAFHPTAEAPDGVLVFLRDKEGNDALTWIDGAGRRVTHSQLAVHQAAACRPEAPARAPPGSSRVGQTGSGLKRQSRSFRQHLVRLSGLS